MTRIAARLTAATLTLTMFAGSTLAIDEAHRKMGETMVKDAIKYLRGKQDAKTGGWAVPPSDAPAGKGMPPMPAITALVVQGMLMEPGITASDPAVSKGVSYVLSFRKPDGGIYSSAVASYNTAISLSMLARVDTPEAKAAIKPGQEFLKRGQWGAPPAPPVPGAPKNPDEPKPVDEKNPYYGGWGYGSGGRPDLSNTSFVLQAFHDTELSREDAAFKRALVFLQRLQMDAKINDQEYAKGSRQGGFIYAAGENFAAAGAGESKAAMIEETMDDGTKVSRLRCYGSMTYSGFKSYIHAGLTPNDPRVTLAMDWARKHYNLHENPGIGTEGFYYYALAMSRALNATGSATIDVTGIEPMRVGVWIDGLPAAVTTDAIKKAVGDAGKVTTVIRAERINGNGWALVYMDKETEAAAAIKAITAAKLGENAKALRARPEHQQTGKRDWQNDLIDALHAMQKPDGSFTSVHPRWMENNDDLITAYALLSLQHALR